MASHNFDITLYQRAKLSGTFTVYQNDGDEWGAGSGDQFRFKVWRTSGAAPALDISSVENINGSSITVTTAGTSGDTAAVVTLEIGGDDAATLTGGTRYRAELGWVDALTEEYAVVAFGYIRVIATATGDRDLAS